MILHVCCFEVFQLTVQVVRGPSELHPLFTVCLDWVAIDHEKVRGSRMCAGFCASSSIYTEKLFL